MTHSRTFRVLFVGTLLASSAVMIVFSFCLLWPVWAGYRDRADFEQTVGPFPHVGRLDAIVDALPEDYLYGTGGGDLSLYVYRRESWFYAIYLQNDQRGETTRAVRVFRAEVPPRPYRPRTDLSPVYGEAPGDPDRAAADFAAALLGDSDAASGLRYRLIYSDPSSGSPGGGEVR